jgi:hypothetical protein
MLHWSLMWRAGLKKLGTVALFSALALCASFCVLSPQPEPPGQAEPPGGKGTSGGGSGGTGGGPNGGIDTMPPRGPDSGADGGVTISADARAAADAADASDGGTPDVEPDGGLGEGGPFGDAPDGASDEPDGALDAPGSALDAPGGTSDAPDGGAMDVVADGGVTGG